MTNEDARSRAEQIEKIRERHARGEYHNHEDFGDRGVYSCEDSVEILLDELTALSARLQALEQEIARLKAEQEKSR